VGSMPWVSGVGQLVLSVAQSKAEAAKGFLYQVRYCGSSIGGGEAWGFKNKHERRRKETSEQGGGKKVRRGEGGR
jgi:hypothetical protein